MSKTITRRYGNIIVQYRLSHHSKQQRKPGVVITKDNQGRQLTREFHQAFIPSNTNLPHE